MNVEHHAKASRQGIKSIEIGGKLLLALEHGRGPMPLSEVARRSDLQPAKAHRYLTSLVRSGLASQDPTTGMYDFGPAARHLGIEALERVESVRVGKRHAVDLRDQIGHTVAVAAWGDGGPLLVGWVTGAKALPIAVRVGSTMPLLDSAIGYIFTAYLPQTVMISALRLQQGRGMTRKLAGKELKALAEGVREQAFASTRDQMIFGIAAMAAPVFGPDDKLELAMAVIMPGPLLAERVAEELGEKLRASAARASRELKSND
jgi:DNA-binding IclR family transcriptional regulator